MFNIKQEPFDECMAVDEPQPVETSNEQTNLIINYLPPNMKDKELSDLFRGFGLVTDVRIIRDKTTGESMCYGFVKFELASNANRARIFLDGTQVDDKVIKVAFARPSSEDIQKAKVYVANFSKHYSKQELNNIFSRFGKVEEVKILLDKQTGTSRGAGFVHYLLKASAEKAISEMNGQMLKDNLKPLLVKLAERPKDWIHPKQRNHVKAARPSDSEKSSLSLPLSSVIERLMGTKLAQDQCESNENKEMNEI